ncbi:hypothetical protein L9F63_001160, partial [Diploptera punctata]
GLIYNEICNTKKLIPLSFNFTDRIKCYGVHCNVSFFENYNISTVLKNEFESRNLNNFTENVSIISKFASQALK